jgi:hypothetical protein
VCFAADNHKVKGQPLDKSSLPHQTFWLEVSSLVKDGAAFAKVKATGGGGGGAGGDGGGYTAVGEAVAGEDADRKLTAAESELEAKEAASSGVGSAGGNDSSSSDDELVE